MRLSWSEKRLVEALRSRYGENEWALLSQVRDGSGWDRRTFDALAIGLWGSRGHPIHGFECKVSRSDWKRELAKPEKADPLVAFCTYWWIVTPKGIVDPAGLPDGWGLLEAHDNGTIHTVHEAERREPADLTRGFVAQIIKRTLAERPADAALREAETQGYERGKQQAERNADYQRQRAEDAEARIAAIEEASGLRLSQYTDLETVRQYGHIIRLAVQSEGKAYDGPVAALRIARDQAQRFIERTGDLFPKDGP